MERQTEVTRCACGCGEPIAPFDARGRARRYAHGHNRRGAPAPWKAKAVVSKRTHHERARKVIDTRRCAVERIGGCKGPIDAHHRDGDETNGAPSNLLALCRAHHRLAHTGRLDLDNPKPIPFRLDASGKRRYEWSGKSS